MHCATADLLHEQATKKQKPHLHEQLPNAEECCVHDPCFASLDLLVGEAIGPRRTQHHESRRCAKALRSNLKP